MGPFGTDTKNQPSFLGFPWSCRINREWSTCTKLWDRYIRHNDIVPLLQVVQSSWGWDYDGWWGLAADLVEVIFDRDSSEEGGDWNLGPDVLAEVQKLFEDLVCELSCGDDYQTLMRCVFIVLVRLDQLQHGNYEDCGLACPWLGLAD